MNVNETILKMKSFHMNDIYFYIISDLSRLIVIGIINLNTEIFRTHVLSYISGENNFHSINICCMIYFVLLFLKIFTKQYRSARYEFFSKTF